MTEIITLCVSYDPTTRIALCFEKQTMKKYNVHIDGPDEPRPGDDVRFDPSLNPEQISGNVFSRYDAHALTGLPPTRAVFNTTIGFSDLREHATFYTNVGFSLAYGYVDCSNYTIPDREGVYEIKLTINSRAQKYFSTDKVCLFRLAEAPRKINLTEEVFTDYDGFREQIRRHEAQRAKQHIPMRTSNDLYLFHRDRLVRQLYILDTNEGTNDDDGQDSDSSITSEEDDVPDGNQGDDSRPPPASQQESDDDGRYSSNALEVEADSDGHSTSSGGNASNLIRTSSQVVGTEQAEYYFNYYQSQGNPYFDATINRERAVHNRNQNMNPLWQRENEEYSSRYGWNVWNTFFDENMNATYPNDRNDQNDQQDNNGTSFQARRGVSSRGPFCRNSEQRNYLSSHTTGFGWGLDSNNRSQGYDHHREVNAELRPQWSNSTEQRPTITHIDYFDNLYDYDQRQSPDDHQEGTSALRQREPHRTNEQGSSSDQRNNDRSNHSGGHHIELFGYRQYGILETRSVNGDHRIYQLNRTNGRRQEDASHNFSSLRSDNSRRGNHAYQNERNQNPGYHQEGTWALRAQVLYGNGQGSSHNQRGDDRSDNSNDGRYGNSSHYGQHQYFENGDHRYRQTSGTNDRRQGHSNHYVPFSDRHQERTSRSRPEMSYRNEQRPTHFQRSNERSGDNNGRNRNSSRYEQHGSLETYLVNGDHRYHHPNGSNGRRPEFAHQNELRQNVNFDRERAFGSRAHGSHRIGQGSSNYQIGGGRNGHHENHSRYRQHSNVDDHLENGDHRYWQPSGTNWRRQYYDNQYVPIHDSDYHEEGTSSSRAQMQHRDGQEQSSNQRDNDRFDNSDGQQAGSSQNRFQQSRWWDDLDSW